MENPLMATRSNSSKGAGRGGQSGTKPVIDHDPLASAEGATGEAEKQAPAKPAPAKKAVKKTAAKKTAEPTAEAEAPGSDGFDMGDSLTIAEVADSHRRLTELLASGGAITLDGGGIEGIDGAGLQLLAALMRDASGQGIEVNWSGASDALKAAADQVGLTDVLGLSAG
jgi:anti-anti-sigma regulatory factor